MLPKEKGEGLTTKLIVESQKITQMSPPPFLGFGSRAQIYTGSPLGIVIDPNTLTLVVKYFLVTLTGRA